MNTAFGSTPSIQPNTSSLFGSNTFNKAPTTSIFNQPANQTTGSYNYYTLKIILINNLLFFKCRCI